MLSPVQHLSLQSSWEYRCGPAHLANFVLLVETWFRHVSQTGSGSLSFRLESSDIISAYCCLDFLGSNDPPTSAFQVARTTGMCHHTWLIFVFFVESGFLHVAQAGLELLGSSDPPTSAFSSAGVIGVSHGARPVEVFPSRKGKAQGEISYPEVILDMAAGTEHDKPPTDEEIVETGFHHIDQAGLEFLTSGDPPAWASQRAEITGMSHRAQLKIKFRYDMKRAMYVVPKKKRKASETEWALTLSPRLECSGMNTAHCNPKLLSSNNILTSVAQ
ncbi:hypothetical protein AAY473_017498, partial [Plecturocebus cupreus]